MAQNYRGLVGMFISRLLDLEVLFSVPGVSVEELLVDNKTVSFSLDQRPLCLVTW